LSRTDFNLTNSSPKNLVLQLAKTEHLSQICQIDHDILGDFWTKDSYLKEYLNPNSCLLCLVNNQKSGDIVVGFGCLWSILEEAHIILLAVIPPYQRQGLGSSLVWGLLSWANQKGLEWATLEVRASNIGAIALYQHFGFTEIGRRNDYYAKPKEAAVIMWRKGLHQKEFAQNLSSFHVQIEATLLKRNWELWVSPELKNGVSRD
jgi:[ribosomal protein S18]-alanine N-acetyltransferase